MINKKNLNFTSKSTFLSKKLSSGPSNISYLGENGEEIIGEPDILWQSVCYIKDTQEIWTHGQLYSQPTKVSELENDSEFISGKILDSKTFTNLYHGQNSYSNGSFPFLEVKPKDPSNKNGLYWIKFRITATAKGYNIKQISDCTIYLYNTGNYAEQFIWNYRNISGTIVNNLYTYYKDRTTFEDVGTHFCAYISSGYNYNIEANSRTVQIDILDISEDLVYKFEDLETPKQVALTDWYKKYTSWSSASSDIATVGLQESSDANNYERLYIPTRGIVSSLYRLNGYGLCGFNGEGRLMPISYRGTAYTTTAYSISNGTRIFNTTEGFDWKSGLFYNGTSTAYAPGATFQVSLYSAISSCDLRYTDNVVASNVATNTLGTIPEKPVYLRGVIKEDGLFYIRPRTVTYNNDNYYAAWIQEIDFEDLVDSDGYTYCYWKISNGYYNSSYTIRNYTIGLCQDKPMYIVKNNELVNYRRTLSQFEEDSDWLDL